MATYKQFGNLSNTQLREIEQALASGRTAAQEARKYGVPAKVLNEAMVMLHTRRARRTGQHAWGRDLNGFVDLGVVDSNGFVKS